MAMQRHIENPFEFLLLGASRGMSSFGQALAGRSAPSAAPVPAARALTTGDLRAALREGLSDLGAGRADVPFLAVVYPVVGILLAVLAFQYELLPLIFPLVSGFALLGPLAAVGLYEISRRRERGEAVSWTVVGEVFRSPAIGSIFLLGAGLLALFFLWLGAAYGIYQVTLGPEPPTSVGAFLSDVFTTPAGWAMIVVGMGVGLAFATLVLAISVFSFPLLLDRNVGVVRAVGASVAAVRANPGPMAVWGAIVAGALFLGSLPALAGLILVIPWLGHATWRLYRRAMPS